MARKFNAVDQRLAAQSHKLAIVKVQAADALALEIVNIMRRYVDGAVAFTRRCDERSAGWKTTEAGSAMMRRYYRELFRTMMDAAYANYADGLNEFAEVGYDWEISMLLRGVPRWYFRRVVATATIGEATVPGGGVVAKVFKIAERLFRKYVAPALEVAAYAEPVAGSPRMSDDEWEDYAKEVIFPPLTRSEIETIVGDDHWTTTFPGNQSKFNDSEFHERLVNGITGGEDVEKLTKSIRDLEAGVYYKARRTARTESLRVAEMAGREAWDDLGDMFVGAQVLAVLDQNTRPHHALRNGTVYANEPQAGEESIDDLPTLPDEPNSVLPGTWIQGNVIAASKARYAGKVAECVTASGRRCTVTFNHPVLTSRGFVKGGELREGDDLIAYGGNVGSHVRGADDVKQKPARIEDVFSAFRESGAARRIPAAAGDFHGDGERFYGDVEIVAPDWKLWRRRNVTVGKRRANVVFQDAAKFGRSRAGDGETIERSVGVMGTETRTASNRRAAGVIGRVASEAEFCCVGSAANLDVAFLEPRGDELSRDAERARELVKRFPGDVAFDRVVSVKVFHYDGPVYDVQTTTGVMVANCRSDGKGLVISNCRCWSVPILAPPEEVASDPGLTATFANAGEENIPDPAAYDQWFDQADEAARRLAVGSRRYGEMAANVKGVRDPEWTDFIDPKTGKLLSRNALSSETDAERAERKNEVAQVIREREAMIREIAAKGFIGKVGE